jgi:DNA-binding HxlR family transcriptional regulator
MDTLQKKDVGIGFCPIRSTLDRVADKWTVLIIKFLDSGPIRFSELQHKIGSISQKMLAQTLREIERDGLINRTVYPTVPSRVEYSLTALGRSLQEPVAELNSWSEEHYGEVTAARELYDKRVDTRKNNKTTGIT